ncbi:hypothetical protein N9L68_03180 [bacterium]|nr:hypothetical protein [bacterium]
MVREFVKIITKVVVALGSRMIDFAKSLLVASAQDESLQKPLQACADISKVIADTARDGLDDAGVVKTKQFAVLHVHLLEKGSRRFIETNIDVISDSPKAILSACAKVNNKLSASLDAYFVDCFQGELSNIDDMHMLIEAAARGSSTLTKDQVQSAQVVLSDIVGPIDDGLQSTKGCFVASEVREHAAKIKATLVSTTAQAAAWLDIVERLAASTVSPRNFKFDVKDVAELMATFDCSGYGPKNGKEIFNIIFEATKENASAAIKDAEEKCEGALIHKSSAFTEGFPNGLGVDGVPLVTEVALNDVKVLAQASGLSDFCAVVQLKRDTDILRIELAKLAASFESGDDTCEFETQVAALDAVSAAIKAYKSAASVDAGSAFKTYVADASVWFRTLRDKAFAKWIESLEVLMKNVFECIPEDWQSYTIESKDDVNILEHIVNNDALSTIMAHSDSLKNARDTIKDALPSLMLDTFETPLKFDTQFEERMHTLYNEASSSQ